MKHTTANPQALFIVGRNVFQSVFYGSGGQEPQKVLYSTKLIQLLSENKTVNEEYKKGMEGFQNMV